MLAFNNSVGFRPWLNSVKASGEPLDFLMVFYRASERFIRQMTSEFEHEHGGNHGETINLF